MNELTNYDSPNLLQFGRESKMFFYLSDNKRIGYVINSEGKWTNHKWIDSQPIKGYRSTLDNKGAIHLIAYTQSRQLIYFSYTEGNWDSQIIERIYSRYQDIPYYSIYSSGDDVHIVYYVNHSLSRSSETVSHYHLREGKWFGGKLWKFMSDQATAFHGGAMDYKKRLHIIFTQRWKGREHLYHCFYNPTTSSWVDPITIHSTSYSNKYEIFADSAHNLHVIWQSPWEVGYRITKLTKSMENDGGLWQRSVVHEGSHVIENPLMAQDKTDLFCFWKEKNSLYKVYSKDFGISWAAPELIKDDLVGGISLIDFSYINRMRTNHLKLWGLGYPEIKIVGLDGEILYGDSQKPPKGNIQDKKEETEKTEGKGEDPSQIKRALASLKVENKALREGINNLFSQIDHLNTIIYNIQDQSQINERSLFNIHAQIKQLDFQIKQVRLKSKQVGPKVYDVKEAKYKPLPIAVKMKHPAPNIDMSGEEGPPSDPLWDNDNKNKYADSIKVNKAKNPNLEDPSHEAGKVANIVYREDGEKNISHISVEETKDKNKNPLKRDVMGTGNKNPLKKDKGEAGNKNPRKKDTNNDRNSDIDIDEVREENTFAKDTGNGNIYTSEVSNENPFAKEINDRNTYTKEINGEDINTNEIDDENIYIDNSKDGDIYKGNAQDEGIYEGKAQDMADEEASEADDDPDKKLNYANVDQYEDNNEERDSTFQKITLGKTTILINPENPGDF